MPGGRGLIGTNDLHTNRRLKEPQGIVSRLEQIIVRIRMKAPGVPIFINSITPRTPWFAPRIRSLNEQYADVARRTGCTYVDLWPALADDAGGLRTELTKDNLHLIEPGYQAWRDVLRPLLRPFALER